jgi:hypothetical protein
MTHDGGVFRGAARISSVESAGAIWESEEFAHL